MNVEQLYKNLLKWTIVLFFVFLQNLPSFLCETAERSRKRKPVDEGSSFCPWRVLCFVAYFCTVSFELYFSLSYYTDFIIPELAMALGKCYICV